MIKRCFVNIFYFIKFKLSVNFESLSVFEGITVVSIYLVLEQAIFFFWFAIKYILHLNFVNNIFIYDIASMIAIYVIFKHSKHKYNVINNEKFPLKITRLLKYFIFFIIISIAANLLKYLIFTITFKSHVSNFIHNISIYDVIHIVVFAPILEELFFRWYLIGRMRKQCSEYACIIVSTLTFSFSHLEVEKIVYNILFGLFFSKIYFNTKNIAYPILFHFIGNAFFIIIHSLYA